jgi:hypothetical protein
MRWVIGSIELEITVALVSAKGYLLAMMCRD